MNKEYEAALTDLGFFPDQSGEVWKRIFPNGKTITVYTAPVMTCSKYPDKAVKKIMDRLGSYGTIRKEKRHYGSVR